MGYFKERNIFIEPEIKPEFQEFPDMHGKKLLVMGGTRGIGLEVAHLSHQQGAKVIVVGRNPAFIDYPQINADLNVPMAVELVWNQVQSADYVLNNVGYYFTKPIVETGADEWEEVIRRNTTNMFHMTKQALIHMNPGGVLVNMSSRPFLDKYHSWSAYTLAKMGVTILTMSAAEEGNINAYAVCPSRVDTAFRDEVFPDEDKRTRLSAEETATTVMYLFNKQLPNGSYYWIKKLYENI